MPLLALPREVGLHPETGKPITAGIGRYGPFVLHDGTFANLDSVEEVFSVGLNRAVTLIAEKMAGGGRRGGRAAPKALKTLGDHPDGGPVTVRDGRYGPYVNHGKVNATLPKDVDPQLVTLEQALELIAARAGKSPARGRKEGRRQSPRRPRNPKPGPRPDRSAPQRRARRKPKTPESPFRNIHCPTTKETTGNKKTKGPRPGLPTREQILAFIAEHPGEAGKREIARAFGITGSARIPLKAHAQGPRRRRPGRAPQEAAAPHRATSPPSACWK